MNTEELKKQIVGGTTESNRSAAYFGKGELKQMTSSEEDTVRFV